MKALVTGGGGYLGRAIVRQLLDRGDAVRVLGRRAYPDVEAWGAEGVQVDLAVDDPALARACDGVDVVFHTAALPPYHAPRRVFEAANVGGTHRVLAACREAGVGRLVYTSTPSVVFDGTPAEGAREADLPYPSRYLSAYADTKAEAERAVLSANDASLATTSLRPRLIYGPDEPHMIPRLLERHRAGRLRVIGDGRARVALTFLDNAAAAHLQAADALHPGAAHAARAYFVSDPEPVALWPWIDALLQGMGEAPLPGRVPRSVAYTAGAVAELAWSWLPLSGEPPMTRFAAMNLSTSHWYDLSGAREDFGYAPPVTGDEGFARTVASLQTAT